MSRLLTAASLCLIASACVGTIDGINGTGLRIDGLEPGRCGEGIALSGQVTLTLTPFGLGGGATVRVTVDDGAQVAELLPDAGDQAPFELQLDTTLLRDGDVRLEAVGTDDRGGAISVVVDLCVDNQGPELTVASPAEGATIYAEDSSLEVVVHAADVSGVTSIEATMAATGGIAEAVCEPTTGPDAVCRFDLSALGAGSGGESPTPLQLLVFATDLAGHLAQVERSLSLGSRLLWQVFAGGAISWAAVPLAGGGAAVGTDAGAIRVVDGAGQEVCTWTAPASGGLTEGIATPMTRSGDGSALFFGTVTHLCSVDPRDCSERWCVAGGLYYGSQPAYDEARGILYLGRYGEVSTRGTLRAHRASNGEEVGSIAVAEVGAGVTGSPTLSADRQTVYIGSTDFSLHAIDISAPSAMTARWSYATGGRLETRPLVLGDRVYIAGYDSQIHAVEAASGARASGFAFLAGAPFVSGVVASSTGTLYAGSLDERLYAIDSSGAELARFELGRMIGTTPVLGADGTLYAARTTPAEVHALDPTLAPLWTFVPPTSDTHEITASPALDAAAGTLYVGSTDGTLYALTCAR